MAYKYTLQDLVGLDRECLTPQHVAHVLQSDPQTIRLCARQRPYLLGFPVIITGHRVKIPRIAFLRYMGVAI